MKSFPHLDSPMIESSKPYFFNRCFDKGRLKSLISWYLLNHGEHQTIFLLEELKFIGFHNATQAGISLSIDDLLIPEKKATLLREAEELIQVNLNRYNRGDLTSIERFQHMIDTWHLTSEKLKNEVVKNFRVSNILNPVYMMAFSGARGNLSQVRQLVGMRGLMSDPQGQIIDFPISSNFREGLTLTEYVISCYGARKGIVDTALRTANSGYLTRRLVDVAQHIMISSLDCGTNDGLTVSPMIEGRKVLLSLKNRLIGRVLAEDFGKLAKRNDIINVELATKIENQTDSILVRSPLTCSSRNSICQLCYGWSLAHNQMVSLGEAVGIIAAQSIGEPGTQLTMRTFHTGGVFSGDALEQIISPVAGILIYSDQYPGELIRTTHGKIAFLIKTAGKCKIMENTTSLKTKAPLRNNLNEKRENYTEFEIPEFSILFVQNFQKIEKDQIIAEYASISAQSNQRVQSKESLTSPFEGQIFFEDVTLGVRQSKTLDSIKSSREFGSLWVLSGTIKESKTRSSFFAHFGDFVHKSAPLAEHSLVSAINGEIYLSHGIDQKKRGIDHRSDSITTNKIGLFLNNIRWVKNSYTTHNTFKNNITSFYLNKIFYKLDLISWNERVTAFHDFKNKLPDKNAAENESSAYSVKICLNSGLAAFSSVNTHLSKQPLFDYQLVDSRLSSTQVKFVSFSSSFSYLQLEEYYAIQTTFDVQKGLFWHSCLQNESSILWKHFWNNRKCTTGNISKTLIRKKIKKDFLVIPLCYEWVASQMELIYFQNRQGASENKSTFFEGFAKAYYTNKVSFTLNSNKPFLNNQLINLIKKSNKNLLFSLIDCWPYEPRENQTSYIQQNSYSTKSTHMTGSVCIDDIIFETRPVMVEISPGKLPPNHHTFEESGLEVSEKTHNDNNAKLSLHFLRYPFTKAKTLWRRSKKNETILQNSIVLIKPLNYSAYSKNHNEFSNLSVNGNPSKHFTKKIAISSSRCFAKNGLTLFGEIIFNFQKDANSPIQINQIGINLSQYYSLLVYRNLHFKMPFVSFVLNKTGTKTPNEKTLYKPQTKVIWRKNGFFKNTMLIFDNYFFSFTANQGLIHSKGKKIPLIKKKGYPDNDVTDCIKFIGKPNEYIRKDQTVAKRQNINRFSGEVVYIQKSISYNKQFNTFEKNAKQKNIFPRELGTSLSSQLIFVSTEDLICYKIGGDAFDETSSSTLELKSFWASLLTSFLRNEQPLLSKKTARIAGQVVAIRKNGTNLILIVRKGKPFLFSSRAIFHVFHNDFVRKDNLMLTLFYRRLQTGDIVQGIPKIEELFEARSSKFGEELPNSVPAKLNSLYDNFSRRMSSAKAVRQSIQIIQQFLVDSVQKVYQSQGVTISDKHLEIIIRQMTSKVKIIDGGQTGFLPGELVSLDTIELINQGIDGPIAKYEPILLGITKASLETKSFISAASFQETTRILARAAVERKTDFLKGLKENVILGHLIPAGTGFREFLSYPNRDQVK